MAARAAPSSDVLATVDGGANWTVQDLRSSRRPPRRAPRRRKTGRSVDRHAPWRHRTRAGTYLGCGYRRLPPLAVRDVCGCWTLTAGRHPKSVLLQPNLLERTTLRDDLMPAVGDAPAVPRAVLMGRAPLTRTLPLQEIAVAAVVRAVIWRWTRGRHSSRGAMSGCPQRRGAGRGPCRRAD